MRPRTYYSALVRVPDERARLRADRGPARGDGPGAGASRPRTPDCLSTTRAPSGRRPIPVLPGTWGLAARLKKEDGRPGWWWWPAVWPRAAGRSSWRTSRSWTCWSGRRACTSFPRCWSSAWPTGTGGRLPGDHHPVERRPASRPGRTGPRAWVQIVAGCSNFCTYCIVPYVRGPEASRPAADILAEVARSGRRRACARSPCWARTSTPTARNRASRARRAFADLLEMACGVPGIERIRFMTSHPKDMSDALIDVDGARPTRCASTCTCRCSRAATASWRR